MYVRDTMTADPYCINKDTKVSVALDIMNQNEFHRLPVVDSKGKLIGLITEGTITESSPSKATSLSIHELNYLLSKTPVEDIMIKNVKTISPDAWLEEAAALMRAHSIGCLPVVENDKVIGIITDNDIFDAFVNLLGYNVKGSRYVVNIEEDTYGLMYKISKCFADRKINITNISTYYGPRSIEIIIIAKDDNTEEMKNVLIEAGFDVISAESRN
ncbi:MAG TPA: hypothetical protein DHS57_03555 [Erysipelotrichaceae bacterium]|jgi:acetoin utilization protein AcuB|nr:hypothetical protein [Erysipelotrichaceae bacterium]